MIERVVRFGDEQRLTGVLSSPIHGHVGLPAVLLLNAGVIHHIGAHRLNVKLARAVAEQGHFALRFDLSGLGDSLPSRETEGFRTQSVRDVQAALDCLERETGCRSAVAIGICSGADNGYEAALHDERLCGLVLLDPYAYPTPSARRRYMLNRATQARRWPGFLRRRAASLWRHLGMKSQGVSTGSSQSSGAAPDSIRNPPPIAEFGGNLKRLTRRGVRLLMVYTASMQALVNAPGQVRALLRPYGVDKGVQIMVKGDVDHTYTELAAQRQLVADVLLWLKPGFATPASAVQLAEIPPSASGHCC